MEDQPLWAGEDAVTEPVGATTAITPLNAILRMFIQCSLLTEIEPPHGPPAAKADQRARPYIPVMYAVNGA
ncbi:hypothetical protein GCM10012278_18550 [Nonomuraea glycinis]|uniref:Uncharacterized protein n=1 Tax=Nonomuraea glycinis TaxID=2047744 RepID=A0A918A2Y5_9ACTN|nr:hypothetical protein GCM10012278_18550 [Nonomuraea glycinis]